jgi:phosphatidylserine decarboxylase
MVPLKSIFGKSARMDVDAPITLFNRHTGRTETEQVYGEKWLQRIYGNPLGKLTLHTVVKRALFSKLYGWAMDRPSSARRVEPFVKAFGLDPAEFADPDLKSYRTFNDFFYRKLKAGARPVDPRAEMAVLPADGRHLGFPDASRVSGIFAKGQTFDIPALVADRALGERYARGTVVCSRLCPVDYHRFHFPVAGVPGEPSTRPRPALLRQPDRPATQRRVSLAEQAPTRDRRRRSVRTRHHGLRRRHERRHHHRDV